MKPQTILILVLVFIVILSIVIFFYLKKKEEERKALEAQSTSPTGSKLSGILGSIGSLFGLYTQVKDEFRGSANTATTTGTSTPFFPTLDGTLNRPLYNPLM